MVILLRWFYQPTAEVSIMGLYELLCLRNFCKLEFIIVYAEYFEVKQLEKILGLSSHTNGNSAILFYSSTHAALLHTYLRDNLRL